MRNTKFVGRSSVLSSNGMAATSQPLSTMEAISILKKGGNAIDAAIAASAVQSVIEPNSTGVGGDCFAQIALNGKKPISINGSGISPLKNNCNFFKKNKINKIDLTSPHSVNIPGAVHAWYTMHKKFGKLDFVELFKSAEKYAAEGFPVHEITALSWKNNIGKLKKNISSNKIFLKNGLAYNYGEIHKNPKLAKTLNAIGKNGIKDFYQGYIAEDIVKSLNKIGGLHAMDDFLAQKTIVSDTITKKYKQKIIHQCPPNGPGITVLLMMGILQKFNFDRIKPLSAERFHLQAEATKIAYEIREKLISDPNFTKIDIKEILNENLIKKISKKIKFKNCYNPINFSLTAHPETVYISVVDKNLNAVSFINSICYAFGSGISTNNTGILLQNRGVNFRLDENHPNCIEGHKRPLHTIMPGMVTNFKDEPILSFGVMGGQYQPVGQVQILQNFFDFDMDIQESIDFPRAFNINKKYILEKGIPIEIFKKLRTIGHNVSYTDYTHGGGQGIYIDRKRGVMIGGSDFRKDGCALGI